MARCHDLPGCILAGLPKWAAFNGCAMAPTNWRAASRGSCIDRDDVLHIRECGRRADDEKKTVRMTAAQERVQVFKLAALAFAAHPDPCLRIPASRAVKQVEHAGIG